MTLLTSPSSTVTLGKSDDFIAEATNNEKATQ
jgi:hypothetical protein